MKLGEVISYVDGIKPNAFTNEDKTRWINEAEGMVQTDVLLLAPEEIITYNFENDREAELLVRPPFDKIYAAYLVAMIDFANGEYNKYQNTYQMFNAHFGAFTNWFVTNYKPADTHGKKYENETLSGGA